MTQAAEKTAMVQLGPREVELRAPTEGALVVLARVSRGLPKIENADGLSDAQRERLVRNLGTLGQIVEGMIVTEDDKDYLDDVMISGEVTAEQVFDAIRIAGEKINGTHAAPKNGPPVKRRRG